MVNFYGACLSDWTLAGPDFGLIFPVLLRRHTSTSSILKVIGDMYPPRFLGKYIGHMAAFLGRFYPPEFLNKSDRSGEMRTIILGFYGV